MTTKNLKDIVEELEYHLALQKAVLSEFPDAKVNGYWQSGATFSSKEVNKSYSNFDFERRYNGLYVLPHRLVSFDFAGKTEIVKVYSRPRSCRLAYIPWMGKSDKRTIKFSRFAFNMKSNSFKDEILNDCRAEIMSFIRDNPGCILDDKHLEPRLKKLILFT